MKKVIIFLLSALLILTSFVTFTACDKGENKDNAVVVNNSLELMNALKEVNKQTDIVLKEGNYRKFTLSNLYHPVKISARGDVRINGIIFADGIKDFTLEAPKTKEMMNILSFGYKIT